MSLIKQCRLVAQKRAELIRDHPGVVVALSKAASANAEGHLQRWIFELLQNAEDARADWCEVTLRSGLCVVTDNGDGLQPSAVEDLSTPYQSGKSGAGTIGRKGVGFSAVYALTNRPMLVSGGEGFIFCPDRFQTWLEGEECVREAGKDLDGHPHVYTLVPFGLRRDEWEATEPLLCEASPGRGTVVCLRLRESVIVAAEIERLLAVDFSFLLTFSNLSHVVVRDEEDDPLLEVKLEPGDWESVAWSGEPWRLKEVRRDEEPRLRRFIRWSKPVEPPADVLTAHIVEPKARSAMGRISLRAALEINLKKEVDVSKRPNFLVYYPTEDPSPLKLLLHADFLVESNRKHILNPEACDLNDWLLDALAEFVVSIVRDEAKAVGFQEAVTLLAPSGTLLDSESNGVGRSLWLKICKLAREILEIAVTAGGFAPLGVVVVPPDFREGAVEDGFANLAKLKFPKFQIATNEIAASRATRRILKSLGVKVIGEEDLDDWMKYPPKELTHKETNEWAWNCWLLLKVITPPATTKAKVQERLTGLKVLPVDGALVECDRRLCFRGGSGKGSAPNLPLWLPVRWLDSTLGDRLQSDEHRDLREFVESLGIGGYKPRDLIEALQNAARQFWKASESERIDYREFLSFLQEQPWLEEALEQSFWRVDLGDLPVMARTSEGSMLRRAKEVYFGREWGNPELEEVFRGFGEAAWLLENDSTADRIFFKCLGVAAFPRRIKADVEVLNQAKFWGELSERLPVGWSSNRSNPRLHYLNKSPVESALTTLEGVMGRVLSGQQTELLLGLLIENWDDISGERLVSVEFSHYSTHQTFKVDNLWWSDLRARVEPPQKTGLLGVEIEPLRNVWAPGSPGWVPNLFPIAEADRLSEFGAAARAMLQAERVFRRSVEDTLLSEWSAWAEELSERLGGLEFREGARLCCRFYDGLLDRAEKESELTGADVAHVRRAIGGRVPALYIGSWAMYPVSSVYASELEDDLNVWSEFVPAALVPRRRARKSAELLGMVELAASLVHQIHSDSAIQPDGELAEWISQVLPYLYCFREFSTRERASFARWKSLEVYSTPSLAVEKRLIGTDCPPLVRRTPWFADASNQSITIDRSAAQAPEQVARSLKVALNLGEGVAQFAETLLRLRTPASMRARLRSEGLSDSEIDEALDTYADKVFIFPERLRGFERPRPVVASPPGEVPTPGEPPTAEPVQSGTYPIAKTRPSPPTEGEIAPKELSLRLPDESAPYQIEKSSFGPSGEPEVGRGRSGGCRAANSSDSSAQQLEQIEGQNELPTKHRQQIEDASRLWVTRELQKHGFVVTPMHRMNPGYDLLAEKDGKIIKVEVKGHLRRADTVELTPTEVHVALQEGPQGRWMLWNVENLDDSSPEQVVLTVVSEIRDQRAKAFFLSLYRCTVLDWPPTPQHHPINAF